MSDSECVDDLPHRWIERVIGALCKYRFPDPFAVATIGGEQTKTTSVIKKTLNPYWNESFDMYENSALAALVLS
ncbi:MAG: hypothetical protein Q9165_002172 [Trypethelium subeluteriae]